MTLLEIMIVVLIISLLAALAIPAFKRARDATQDTRFVNDMHIIVGAFEQRSFYIPFYPPETAPGVVPEGMEDYLRGVDWDEPTPLGGQWDWAPDEPGYGRGIMAIGIGASIDRMQEIDAKLDDGNLATGLFQKTSDENYFYKIE